MRSGQINLELLPRFNHDILRLQGSDNFYATEEALWFKAFFRKIFRVKIECKVQSSNLLDTLSTAWIVNWIPIFPILNFLKSPFTLGKICRSSSWFKPAITKWKWALSNCDTQPLEYPINWDKVKADYLEECIEPLTSSQQPS